MSDYLEMSALDTLSQFLNQDDLLEVLDRYIENSGQIICQLEDALSAKDAYESRRMTHSLISSSAHLGAMPLSALSRELEELCKAEKLDEVIGRVDELKQCHAGTIEVIQQLEIMQSRKTG